MAARAGASQWLPGELSAPAGRALMPSAGQRAKKMGPSPNALHFTASQGLVGEVWRLCPLFLFKKKKKKRTFLSAPGTVQPKSSLFKECNPNLKCNLSYVFPKSQILLFSGKGVYVYHSMVVSEVKVQQISPLPYCCQMVKLSWKKCFKQICGSYRNDCCHRQYVELHGVSSNNSRVLSVWGPAGDPGSMLCLN